MAASGAGDGRSSTAQVRRCSLGHTPPHKPLTCRTDQPCVFLGGGVIAEFTSCSRASCRASPGGQECPACRPSPPNPPDRFLPSPRKPILHRSAERPSHPW